MRRVTAASTEQPFVTWALIAVNVAVYLITVAQGNGINSPGGSLFARWVLYGPAVANGDWWRLITAAFLHASLLHIGLNMLALVWLGAPVERYLGHFQYLALYMVSGLAGSAGALITTPTGITVGASGAIFGILGAMLIIEYQATGNIAGQAFTLIAINLLFSFTMSGISVGGHIGGLDRRDRRRARADPIRADEPRPRPARPCRRRGAGRSRRPQHRGLVLEGPWLRVSEYRPVPLVYERLSEDVSLERSREFLALLQARRSIRRFSTEPVPWELVENALRAAGTAPSGAHQQPWTFVVVSDPETKRRLREGAEAEERDFYERRATDEWKEAIRPIGTDWVKTHITDAPYVIVVFEQPWRPENGQKVKHYYVRESVGIAVGFLLAALQAAGLCALTHTPSPMRFLGEILGRPGERAAVHPDPGRLPRGRRRGAGPRAQAARRDHGSRLIDVRRLAVRDVVWFAVCSSGRCSTR